ncbi:unnamed protein product [Penicillium salamii]|uniref:UBX domain-containing protein n=1 Tax=Penicillium salamii TaxID=1612424 RepID=A0A9W4NIX3_9EURO|nr:unnamed protein product [Penicillium salamii]CAG8202264.1 unnamed protein product [Penicillium salamii]CAG8202915.1 unnamed protein product [Penicillium salamii]CAG8213378.1 unnamed protein product [Penicillium salamii]CAG8217529.1 unnamed protein product [Penicillium salamii]
MDNDVVAQFTEITGSTPELAIQYLQITDFNIEQAMQLFFENGGAPLTSEPSQPRGSGIPNNADVVNIDSDTDDETPRRSAAPAFDDDEAMARRLQEQMYGGQDQEEEVRAPMARTTETLVGPGADYDDDGEDMHANILSQLRARQRGGRAGIFNQRESSSIWTGGDDSRREELSAATGGASDASSKSNMLAEMYRPPFEIMSRLPWDAARDEGKDSEKWLLINVQDASVFDCQVLNRDLWKDSGVQDTVKEHFIFLQYSKDDPRAASYIQYYFQGSDVSDNYPHIAIVDPRTGEQMKIWSGPPLVKPADFLMQLHEFLDRYSLNHNVRNPVAKRKSEKKEKTVDAMTEEEMMEMAMRNSLGGAGESGPAQEDPDDLTRSTDDVKGKSRAAEEDVSMDEPENTESSPFASIPSDKPHTEPEADPVTTTRIQFRHPSGRVIRRFALSDPVQRIYEWLKAEPPLEDKAGVEFDLNNMGRNLIDQLPTSIAEAGLKNGTVMIGYVEE